MKTLYSILGVDPGVSPEDLEQAYLRRKVAYPQAKLDTDEILRIQWQGIEQAYKTLANPDARNMYDRRLKNAGVKTVTVMPLDDGESARWFSTRNVIIVAVVVLVVAGMWFYQAREKAQMQKQIIEQALRIAEDEKRKQAEIQAAEEDRNKARFDSQQRREGERREEQLRREALQAGREVSREVQSQTRQDQSSARQEENRRQQTERNEQAVKRQAQYEAERRLANEKSQLRSVCMQRYGRPDC